MLSGYYYTFPTCILFDITHIIPCLFHSVDWISQILLCIFSPQGVCDTHPRGRLYYLWDYFHALGKQSCYCIPYIYSGSVDEPGDYLMFMYLFFTHKAYVILNLGVTSTICGILHSLVKQSCYCSPLLLVGL